jgi:hypothetical protein
MARREKSTYGLAKAGAWHRVAPHTGRDEKYEEAFEAWDYMPGEDGCPFEPKACDWGWLNGRKVALDYSIPGLGGRLTYLRTKLPHLMKKAGQQISISIIKHFINGDIRIDGFS